MHSLNIDIGKEDLSKKKIKTTKFICNHPIILFTDAGEDFDDSVAIILLICRHMKNEINFEGIVLCGVGRMQLRIKVICRIFFELNIPPQKVPPIFTGSYTQNTKNGNTHVFRQKDFAEGNTIKEEWHGSEFDKKNKEWREKWKDYINKIEINNGTGYEIWKNLDESYISGIKEPLYEKNDLQRYETWKELINGKPPKYKHLIKEYNGIEKFKNWFKNKYPLDVENIRPQIVSIGPMDSLKDCIYNRNKVTNIFSRSDLIAMVGSIYKWYGAPGTDYRIDPIKGYHPPEFNANQAGSEFADVMLAKWNRKVIVPLDTCGFIEYISINDSTSEYYDNFFNTEDSNNSVRLFLELYEQWVRIFQLQPSKRGEVRSRRKGYSNNDTMISKEKNVQKIGILFDTLPVLLAGNLTEGDNNTDKNNYIYSLNKKHKIHIYKGGKNGDWFSKNNTTGWGICGKILTNNQFNQNSTSICRQNKLEVSDSCNWVSVDKVNIALYWSDEGKDCIFKKLIDVKESNKYIQSTIKTIDAGQRESTGFKSFMKDVHDYIIESGKCKDIFKY